MVIPVSVQDMPYALQIARSIRADGVRTEVDVTGHGIGAGLKGATKKHIHQALIVGEDERRTNVITLRDLAKGEEHVLTLEALLCRLTEKE